MTKQEWMQQALELARLAYQAGEVPIGAIIVHNDQIIARAYNSPITHHDPTAHAEILALRAAGGHMGNYRLLETTMYVTLEPCAMCAMALVHARVSRLVFGAFDPKTGAVCSQFNLYAQAFINHRVQWEGGILADTCGSLLQDFFAQRRKPC